MTRICLAAILLLAAGSFAHAQNTPAPPTTVDLSRGGLTIASGVNSLTIGARGQFRWTLDDREEADADTAGSGLGADDGVQSQFDVVRLRVTFSGGAFRPWMKYLFQLEMSRTGGEGGSRIKDAILEIRPTDRSYRFQVGQFKVPFGLQELNSSGRLQFVDRAITDAKFNPARDMGVMFAGTAVERKVGYELGVFNGSGESIRQNNRSHLWVGRVYVDPFGTYALAESAVDAGERPILHLGAAVRGGKPIRGRSVATTFDDADNQQAFNVEFAFKAPRFYSTGEYFWMTDEQSNPVPGPDIDSRGYHVQAGVMVVPRKTDVGILYARIDGNTAVDDAEVTEVRGVVGHYWQAHNLKLQADIGQVGFGSAFPLLSARARAGLPALGTRLVTGQDFEDTQLRVQLTLAF